MVQLFFVAFVVTALVVVQAGDIIIPPPVKKSGPVAVLYFAQGADIETEQYRMTLTTLQDTVHFPLWVGIAQSPMNVAAVGLSQVMAKLSKKMKALGMDADYEFYGGHSLGGAMTPYFVNETVSDTADGVILMGSFLTREFKTGATSEGRPQVEFPVPVLTIGGELDGLCRLTRITEALYSQVTFSADPERASMTMPVTVIEGLNHMMFASGTPPEFVKRSDLQAELSEDEAHSLIARDAGAFLDSIVYPSKGEYSELLRTRVTETTKFVEPITNAFLMEGYEQFLPACYCESVDEYGGLRFGTCTSTPSCNGGVRWTGEFSQVLMGGLEDVQIIATDSIHRVTETDPDCHHPHIHGGEDREDNANPGNGKYPPICETPDSNCVLNITTITEHVYDNGGEVDIWRIHFPPEHVDTGYLPLAAREMRTKMMSRQAVWNAAGILDTNFTETDGMLQNCMEINQRAIDWGMSTVAEKTRSRYNAYGQTLSVLPDSTTCVAGPCWIWDPLKFNRDDENNTVTVQSVIYASENTNKYPCGEKKKLPCSSGFHYCKILSPARVVEWMYVDGLRNKLGTKNV